MRGAPSTPFAAMTADAVSLVEQKAPAWWRGAIAVFGTLTLILLASVAYLTATGVGVFGDNHPVGWGWDIANFVFWIGLGHAGTLISAILFITRQRWRTFIHRASEAMTLFAVICAAVYAFIHLGRLWMAWFLIPVPNSYGMWPNFRSALLWDFFAISTYFTVSFLFCYLGLIPDLATMRDRAKTCRAAVLYGLLAWGWRGSSRQWRQYEMAYLLLAGVSTPLVLSVHSIVSFDFSTSLVPGWHSTIFPPYFVAGAILGGCAMVLTLLIPICRIHRPFQRFLTPAQVEPVCKIILLTGSILGYAYGMEVFTAWFSGNLIEWQSVVFRATGPYAWAFWLMVIGNVLAPQLFWIRYFRTHLVWVWIIVQFPSAGMWFERLVIIVSSLSQDFTPSAWGLFHPTPIDIAAFAGTFGLFVTLFLLFIRCFPMVSMHEVKASWSALHPHPGKEGQP